MNLFTVANVRFLGRSAGMMLETNDDNLDAIVDDTSILNKAVMVMGFDNLADYNQCYGLERLLGRSLATLLKISKNYNRSLASIDISRHEENADGLKISFDAIFDNRDARTDPYILYPTLETAMRVTYPESWPYNVIYHNDKRTVKYMWFCIDWSE